ncbi:Fur family transcriptional regulator [uncultured Bacteroides sp.]|uniref:Fur family transcriptional regulator n=1 Tax=uncultured Bacteroides sp. TaxID=162156 RepID=UPI00260B8E57|nr:transcriptional repressor [uncultured Bacteroides sp.]
MKDAQYYLDRLEKKNVKPTAIRLLVLKAMDEADRAVSMADLEMMLDTVDKSTIFRTLTLFLQHHVIHDIEDGSGSLKYEICSSENSCSIDDMHIHFYCEVCQKTFCFHSLHIPRVQLPDGFQVHGINYMVKGVCDKCAAKQK